ncbi:hypothetical protein [Sphingomonas endolithica]|nr:hypothetical protein [Sphingomonas sp. ZFBP2030]
MLRVLLAEGSTIEDVADELGRTLIGVKYKARALDIPIDAR